MHIGALKAHKILFEIAEASNIKMINGIPDDEFANKMEALVIGKVILPEACKSAIFSKKTNDDLNKCVAARSLDALRPLLERVMPVCEGDGIFDPRWPKLAHLDAPGHKKFGMFQRLVIERVLIPMMAQGEGTAVIVCEFSKLCLREFEQLGDLGLNDGSLHIVMDCLTIWRAVIAVHDQEVDKRASPEDLNSYEAAVTSIQDVCAYHISERQNHDGASHDEQRVLESRAQEIRRQPFESEDLSTTDAEHGS